MANPAITLNVLEGLTITNTEEGNSYSFPSEPPKPGQVIQGFSSEKVSWDSNTTLIMQFEQVSEVVNDNSMECVFEFVKKEV